MQAKRLFFRPRPRRCCPRCGADHVQLEGRTLASLFFLCRRCQHVWLVPFEDTNMDGRASSRPVASRKEQRGFE
jgi:hypothetical protein